MAYLWSGFVSLFLSTPGVPYPDVLPPSFIPSLNLDGLHWIYSTLPNTLGLFMLGDPYMESVVPVIIGLWVVNPSSIIWFLNREDAAIIGDWHGEFYSCRILDKSNFNCLHNLYKITPQHSYYSSLVLQLSTSYQNNNVSKHPMQICVYWVLVPTSVSINHKHSMAHCQITIPRIVSHTSYS